MVAIAGTKGKEGRPGPDGLYSWLVAVCGGYCCCVAIGILRSQGMLYLATMSAYDLSRKQASWPYSVFLVAFFLVGPVCGILGSIFGLRKVLMTGAAVCSLGLVASFLCRGVVCLSVTYGVVTGIGIGFIYRMVPPIVNQHFEKHRSSAMGIALAGSSLGTILLPVVSEALLFGYGFQGTFLLLGCFTLNILVAACLMKSPPWIKVEQSREDKRGRTELVAKHASAAGDVQKVMPTTNAHHSGTPKVAEQLSLEVRDRRKEGRAEYEAQNDRSEEELAKSSERGVDYGTVNKEKQDPETGTCEKGDKLSVCSEMKVTLQVLKSPMFYILCSAFCASFFNLSVYCTVIIDFAIDKGVRQVDAKYILVAFAATEMCSKLSLGWVTDKGFVQRKVYLVLALLLSSLTSACQPYCSNFQSLLALAFIYGLAYSSSATMLPLLLSDYLGRRNHSISFGLMSSASFPLPFLLPSLIGYFREGFGSYDGIFYISASLKLFSASLWLLESRFTNKSQSK